MCMCSSNRERMVRMSRWCFSASDSQNWHLEQVVFLSTAWLGDCRLHLTIITLDVAHCIVVFKLHPVWTHEFNVLLTKFFIKPLHEGAWLGKDHFASSLSEPLKLQVNVSTIFWGENLYPLSHITEHVEFIFPLRGQNVALKCIGFFNFTLPQVISRKSLFEISVTYI